jgi:hypothetical protein
VSYELNCVTCGCPTTAVRKNARHCHPCGVLKVLTYLRSRYKRPRKCMGCEARFRPASQNDIALCYSCATAAHGHPPKARKDTVCVFCSGTVLVGSLHRKICTPCMKNPIRQDEIAALLSKQQVTRIAEHGEHRATAPNVRKVS